MKHLAIESTSIRSVGYDEATKTLEVTFRSGLTYQYKGVPEATFRSLVTAESAGKYFAQNIKDEYAVKKV